MIFKCFKNKRLRKLEELNRFKPQFKSEPFRWKQCDIIMMEGIQ